MGKFSAYAALTSGYATGDLILLDDISDTSMAASGTTKVTTLGNLLADLPAGILFLGTTTNAKMTNGVTINQGANDNEIMAFKSSDVGHPITDESEADTFGVIKKASDSSGGLRVLGYKDADGSASGALKLEGILGEAADTTKSAAGRGVIRLACAVTNGGTARAGLGAGENLVSIGSGGTTRFIFEVNGEMHSDAVIGIGDDWDDYEDISLLRGLKAGIQQSKDPAVELDTRTREMIEYAKPILEATKVVTYNEDGHHFIANQRLAWLTIDAMGQLHDRIEQLESKYALLEQ